MHLVSFDEYSDYLAHHGIMGQKWGVRRYQNADGSLTDAGRRRNNIKEETTSNKIRRIMADKAYVLQYKIAPNSIKPPKETKEQIEWVKATSERLDLSRRIRDIALERTRISDKYDHDISPQKWSKDDHDKYSKLVDEEFALNDRLMELEAKKTPYPETPIADKNHYYKLFKVKV